MGEKMSLVETIIRNLEKRRGFDAAFDLDDDVLDEIKQEMADAIDSHLPLPAQAVDVGAIREVIGTMRRFLHSVPAWEKEIDKLTAALSGKQP